MGSAQVFAIGPRNAPDVPRAVCEAALAHTVRDKTEAAYHRTDLFQRRRELMTSWSAFATGTVADVVAIRA